MNIFGRISKSSSSEKPASKDPQQQQTNKVEFNSEIWKGLLGKNLLGQDGKTVNIGDVLSDKECIALYFSAAWCKPCRQFTPKFVDVYKQLQQLNKKFEVVYISSDTEIAQFDEYFGEMPWLALPFSERERKATLSSKFKVSGVPVLALLSADGSLITTKVATFLTLEATVSNVAKFPWIPRSLRENIGLGQGAGASFVNREGVNKDVDGILKEVDVLGLYFAANWCGPCKTFTPKLEETYKKLKEAGKKVEIVLVSGDKTPEEFKEYLAGMPWWALPYEKREEAEELANMFNLKGVPLLAFVDAATGKTITKNGRGSIMAPTFIDDFPLAKAFYPKPIKVTDGNSTISLSGDSINDSLSLIVFLETANPEQRGVVLAAFGDISKKAFEKEEGDRTVGNFFTVHEKNALGDNLRQWCKLDANDKPQMVLLDLPDNGGFYLSSQTEVTKESIEAFIEDHANKRVPRSQISI